MAATHNFCLIYLLLKSLAEVLAKMRNLERHVSLRIQLGTEEYIVFHISPLT
jgi:hypothetical protein